MSIQDDLRQWSSSTLNEAHLKSGFDAADRIDALEEELIYWVSQYGCECGHPSCSKCRDTKDVKELLTI